MFPCTRCGLCCQNISTIPELRELDLGNGICKYFNAIDNSCIIYKNRPDICRIDKMFKNKYQQQFLTKNMFYKENARVCNLLQQKHHIDDNFRVRIRGE